jgi:hypothetical protein
MGARTANPFIKFMISPMGRAARIVVGAALVVWGLFGLDGGVGIVVAIVGVVPLLAGALDVCIF